MVAEVLPVVVQPSRPGESRPDMKWPASVSTPAGEIFDARVKKPASIPLYKKGSAIRYLRQATPKKVRLGSLNHPYLFLNRPIPLSIEREGDYVVASHAELEEFGFGKHLSEAIEDFRQTLIELFLTLEKEKEKIGPELARVWEVLQELIIKR